MLPFRTRREPGPRPEGDRLRTPGYAHEFGLDLSNLAEPEENVLAIENLERRWFGIPQRQLVLDQFAW